jgi:hypothetical protein
LVRRLCRGAAGALYGSGYVQCVTGNPDYDPHHPERLLKKIAEEYVEKQFKKVFGL